MFSQDLAFLFHYSLALLDFRLPAVESYLTQKLLTHCWPSCKYPWYVMLWYRSRLGSLAVGAIALRKYWCIDMLALCTFSCWSASIQNLCLMDPLGFFWWWVVVFLVFFSLLFKTCGEKIIERNTASGCPQWKKRGQTLMFCLDALCWMIIKTVLLCSTFQQHALIVFIKAVLLDMFYRRENCDTTQWSVLSHCTLPSTWRDTLWLFGLSKGSITATLSPSTWKVTLCFMCFFLCAFSLQHPFLNILSLFSGSESLLVLGFSFVFLFTWEALSWKKRNKYVPSKKSIFRCYVRSPWDLQGFF